MLSTIHVGWIGRVIRRSPRDTLEYETKGHVPLYFYVHMVNGTNWMHISHIEYYIIEHLQEAIQLLKDTSLYHCWHGKNSLLLTWEKLLGQQGEVSGWWVPIRFDLIWDGYSIRDCSPATVTNGFPPWTEDLGFSPKGDFEVKCVL